MPDAIEAGLLLGVAACAFALSALATRWLHRGPLARRGPLDRPNARSLHRQPVPRTGGLAVLLGALAPLGLLALALWSGLLPDDWHWPPGAWPVDSSLPVDELAASGAPPTDSAAPSVLPWSSGSDALPVAWLWLAAALVPVALISFLDDLRGVPHLARLLAHLTAALLLLAGGLSWTGLELPGLWLPLPAWLAGTLTLLQIVWTINLYNFMDGMDGLAGTMAVTGFGALAALGLLGGEPLFALTAAAVAAAAAGFLTGNLPPARLFLGDSGSASLGLLAAGLSLWGAGLGLFPLWVAALAFSPFILDATWTLLVRLRRRERVWEAHRSHHYQRLVLAGWSHRQTLARALPLMLASAACAVAAPRLPPSDQWLLIGAWAVIYALIHLRVGMIERDAGADSSSGDAGPDP